MTMKPYNKSVFLLEDLYENFDVSVSVAESSICGLRLVAEIKIGDRTFWTYLLKRDLDSPVDLQAVSSSVAKKSVSEKFDDVLSAKGVCQFEAMAGDAICKGLCKYAEENGEKASRRNRIIRQINYENSWKDSLLPYAWLQKFESVAAPLLRYTDFLRSKYSLTKLLKQDFSISTI